MATYTVTLGEILRSFMTNSFGEPNPTGVKEGKEGDYYSQKEIIDKTYENLFTEMTIVSDIDDEWKKDFCAEFYDREIGMDTWARSRLFIQKLINIECNYLFKFRRQLKDMDASEWIQTGKTTTTTSGDNKNKQLALDTPENNLDMVWPGTEGNVLKYASTIGEGYGQNTATGESISQNTRPMFEQLYYFAQLTSIDEEIMNIMNRAFLQIY